jgi:CHAT domain-containing protein
VSRVVTTDRALARDKLTSPRLKVLIAAPEYRGSSALRTQEEELRLVERRFRRAGATVTVLNSHVKAQAFSTALRDTHILHFVGHATHDPFVPGRSAIELSDGPITAMDLVDILKEGRGPSFVFINACSSGAEEPWSDGSSDLYGIASPFIRSGAYFVGARWPVHEIFATEFADIFYRSLLPSFGFRAWARWLAGRIIEGETLGTALTGARLALNRGPATLATWSAYVAYGDPTAKFVLR